MLQTKVPGDRDFRICNPERDLIWALPRMVSRAIRTIGTGLSREGYAARLKRLLRSYDIPFGCQNPDGTWSNDAGTDELLSDFKEFATTFAALWHHLRDDPRELGVVKLREFYDERRFRPFVALVSRLLVKQMVAEVSYWICQVEASSKEPPRPDIERIDEATREILDQLG